MGACCAIGCHDIRMAFDRAADIMGNKASISGDATWGNGHDHALPLNPATSREFKVGRKCYKYYDEQASIHRGSRLVCIPRHGIPYLGTAFVEPAYRDKRHVCQGKLTWPTIVLNCSTQDTTKFARMQCVESIPNR